MARLDELTPGAVVRGVLPDRAVRVVAVAWHGASALTLTYTDEATGRPDHELLDRDDEARLAVESAGRAWSLDADGELFRLVSEAKRISLAYLFDPFLAVQTSNLDPLPHQIDVVYGRMLDRQPLRFLLADDPGAGKTIMAGLFCKELMVRGDVERCMVIAPGSLVEQWQDELWEKFGLRFEILTKDMIEAARTGNPFAERPLLIARLDHLARNEELQAKLEATDWDLVVVDEAHKMSAHYVSGEVKETKRYKLGRLVGSLTRHLLLMTATPHAGIEEDFHLFLALLDSDRFEGRHGRDGNRSVDVSDIMRRLVKEKLLKFDGTPLFPERRAYSVAYPLSDAETLLYKKVTEYVQDEMNRADRLKAAGEGRRGAVVGFALTTLQRRLASSPEAIYQSLVRRRNRLEKRRDEEHVRKRGADAALAAVGTPTVPHQFRHVDDDVAEGANDGFDLDDLPDSELEELEEELVDQASAARTIAELSLEIDTLRDLEKEAHRIVASGADRKWEELSGLLRDRPEMFDTHGARRKLIVFTEHRDTLNYLVARIRTLLDRDDAVVAIHGGLPRDERRKVQELFTKDKGVAVLVATDAAGEGINLQRAHLMVNYDLPWNPNRLEQRFGRVHRIGQTEVCHLWNLVAERTREGQVFRRLFTKLDEQRRALGDQVFDVLGEAFRGESLRELLIKAVRYGERPDVLAQLDQVVDETVGDSLRSVISDRALVTDVMSMADVERIHEAMERAEARRLQPHFIRSFFLDAFALLGGTIKEREQGRFEITHVPGELRQRDRQIGSGAPLLRRYERITFERHLINVDGRPQADYVTPGHPLLDVTIDMIVERYGSLLRQGTVLVDDTDPGDTPRALLYLEHTVVDGRTTSSGDRQVASRRFEFVEVDPQGTAQPAGWAPYLDCRSVATEELNLLGPELDQEWLSADLETVGMERGVELARAHLDDVKRLTLNRVDKTTAAVRERLTTEIRHWDHRANELKEKELAGRLPQSGMNSVVARRRADDLEARLKRRLAELDAERQLAPKPPVVAGGFLVVPAGLLAKLRGETESAVADHARETEAVERAAVEAVLATERSLGHIPIEMPRNNKGYDIESKDERGNLWFVEVKGRIAGAETFAITRSEVGVGLNKSDRYILALVEVSDSGGTNMKPVTDVRYVRHAFDHEPDRLFRASSLNLPWREYFTQGDTPT